MSDGPGLLTTEEAAARLRLEPETLEKWRGEGIGPKFIKMGRARGSRVVYRISDLIEFERRCTVTPTVPKKASRR